MESRAVHALFPADTPCSSSKSLTGHCLGAAGAIEAAFCWLVLSREWNPSGLIPPHLCDGGHDPDLPAIRMARAGDRMRAGATYRALSSSFAFGGNNCALIFGRAP
jgi:3-oxoacyl-[acyl-carrier-protein] synthase-1